MSNADFVFQFFVEHGYAFGDCGDETALVDALAKSVSYSVKANRGPEMTAPLRPTTKPIATSAIDSKIIIGCLILD